MTDRARQLFRDAIVVDLHNDLPTRILDDGFDPDRRHPPGFEPAQGHTDLPRLVESGIAAQVLAAWVNASYARTPGASFERAMRLLDAVHAFVDRHPDHLRFATTAADIERARSDGKVAILAAVEGGHAIEDSLDNLRALHARGASYLTLTWNNGNAWAGSSIGADGTRTGGLTDFGREVIREMNRLGMLVDVSHVSDATFRDVLETSTRPVIASHSNARALAGHPRNLTDEMLRAVAATGGVIGVNFYTRFLDDADAAAREAMDRALDAEQLQHARLGADDASLARWRSAEERRRGALLPPVPLSALVDHIEHIARVAGVAHVALGSDFDGISAVPQGMDDVTCLPVVATALLERGWLDDDVRKVLGGNAMRVMKQVLDGRPAPDT